MWRLAATTGSVGLEMGISIAIGCLGGLWLDKKFNTTPWLFYIGFFSGLGAATKAIIRVTRRYQRQLEEDETQNPLTPKPPAHKKT